MERRAQGRLTFLVPNATIATVTLFSQRLRVDLESLSDEELIRRIVAQEDADVRDELARRSQKRLKSIIRKMVYGKRGVCPPAEDRDAFAEDATSRAVEKLFKSLPPLGQSLDHWLPMIARCATADYARYLRRHTPKQPAPVEAVDEGRGASFDVVSRPYCGADAAKMARDRELRMILGAMIAHAKKDPLSAQVIRLAIFQGHTIAEIANRKGTYRKKIERILEHDYKELRQLLGETFGVRSLGDLLAD